MGDVPLPTVDLKVAIPTASLACYLVYKRYEPTSPLLNAILLIGAPFALVLTTQDHVAFVDILTVLFACWALIITLTLAYRLSPFHPLASFPGPALAKASKLYHVFFVLRGDAHMVIRRWHDRYGDVVRIGPNELSFKRADAVYPILGARKLKKGPFYDIRVSDSGLQIDAIKDFDLHAIRRKPWTRALAPGALKDYEEIIMSKTGLLMEKLAERVRQDVDISAWMSYYGFDFMGQLAFAREFGMMKAGADTEGLWHMMDTAVLALATLSVIPWTGPFLKALPGAGNALKKFERVAASYATHRVTAGSQYKDLWYHLTNEGNTLPNAKTPLPNHDATADAFTAVVAGSDTVATVLSHFWYLMLRHPECCERLYEEVVQAFPDVGEEMPRDFRRLEGLEYLNACLNESMRMFSPVLSGQQRRVELGTGGAMIGPYFVPEGTNVSVHMTSLYRNPSVFSPLSDTFWPDRWLTLPSYTLPSPSYTLPSPSPSLSPSTTTTISPSEIKLDKTAFIPFSTGQQSCPGKNLAWMELRGVVACVVGRYRLGCAEGYDVGRWEKEVRDAHATLRGELVVRLEKR
ncbi:cytochrome P450 [Irpex lacteus]|nr:cytochrome P450 [Irpex lacteus]